MITFNPRGWYEASRMNLNPIPEKGMGFFVLIALKIRVVGQFEF